jgi:uncharacterized protein (DUF885 family)
VRVLGFILLLVAVMGPSRLSAGEPDARLSALFEEDWSFRLAEDPLFATSAGEHRYDALLPQMTRADLERRAAHDRAILERWKGIDRAALSPSDRVNAEMFGREVSDRIARYEFGATAGSTPTLLSCRTACPSEPRRTTRITSPG